MGTSLSEIVDLFQFLQQDYKLTALYESSGSTTFVTYHEPWLLMAIDDFEPICTQVLTYDSGSQIFSVTLTQKNQNILAQIMVLYWLQKEVHNVLQMNNLITDKDFRTFSAAQNLREKRELLNAKREEISQLLLNYGYKNNTWDDWADQNFV
jgi:ABC-type uncharacterized transport system ATPase subunit